MNDDTPTPFNRDLDSDLDYGDWQAEQAYEKYVADQEAAVETDSEPTTLHTGLEDTAADEAPVAVKRHPGTPSPSLQDIILDRLAREGRQPPPMTAEQERRFFDAR